MNKLIKYIKIFTSRCLWQQFRHAVVLFLSDNVWGIINLGLRGQGVGIRPTAILAHAENIFIHDGSDIQRNVYLMAGEKSIIRIGENCSIGPGVFIASSNHGFRKGQLHHLQPAQEKDVIIGSDVFIGAHAIILPGVKIGDGAVIGAGSVVLKDIPENAIALGVPATVKCYRC